MNTLQGETQAGDKGQVGPRRLLSSSQASWGGSSISFQSRQETPLLGGQGPSLCVCGPVLCPLHPHSSPTSPHFTEETKALSA